MQSDLGPTVGATKPDEPVAPRQIDWRTPSEIAWERIFNAAAIALWALAAIAYCFVALTLSPAHGAGIPKANVGQPALSRTPNA
jgi:hypothetical protein